ncbi:MAG: 5'-3'-deoxyribonucleotidase [Cyclobacteriaceae bacterium]
MKRLIIDMDDVMADATGQFIDYYEKEFGVRIDRAVLHGKGEGEGFPNNHRAIAEFPYRENFFRTMSVHEHCQEVMEKLNKKYEVFIVSAAMEFPRSLQEKLSWLQEHFPFLSWKQFVFCGSKTVVYGDYMIDDLVHNLEPFKGEKFIFTAPHNIHLNHYQRLNNWKEVGGRFL